MEFVKLRMTEEKIDYLQRKLEVKDLLLARATDKGNRDLIDRIREERKAVEQEIKDAQDYLEDLKYDQIEQKAIAEEQYLLGQQDLLAQ